MNIPPEIEDWLYKQEPPLAIFREVPGEIIIVRGRLPIDLYSNYQSGQLLMYLKDIGYDDWAFERVNFGNRYEDKEDWRYRIFSGLFLKCTSFLRRLKRIIFPDSDIRRYN